MKILIIVLRIFLGFVFICSAGFKLASIDEFELYIYSHNFLSLNLSFIAARLVISFEFFIGLMLIINIYARQIWYISVATLTVFTIYLIIIELKGNTDNCHCFGEFLRMSPLESIIKNIVLLILFIPLRKNKGTEFKYKLVLTIFLLLLSISIPAIISPPDFLFSKRYAGMTVVNKDGMDSIVFDNEDFPFDMDGKKVLCFYSASCRFCTLSEKKISSMVVKNGLDPDNFINIFWGDPANLYGFYSENSIKFKSTFIQATDFFRITEGSMPLIVLVENKAIKEKFGYRNIDEKIITDFLLN